MCSRADCYLVTEVRTATQRREADDEIREWRSQLKLSVEKFPA
jgi:hypothetical protein